MFTDSHCHLSFPELQQDLAGVLSRMEEAKVTRAICICTTLEEFEAVHALAAAHPQLWATVGVHPDNEDVQEPDTGLLVELAGRERIVGIGETGLDYYRLNGRTIEDMQWQRDRFVAHIHAARQTDLPLIIHTRSASDDTVRILKEEGGFSAETSNGQSVARGVFHCFTETEMVARAALDLDFYISFSGIITFKNAEDLRNVVRFVPLEKMLIETDSPYLAPVPYRGKTNSPAWVPHVAAMVAEIKGVTIEAVAEATSTNVDRLFNRIVA